MCAGIESGRDDQWINKGKLTMAELDILAYGKLVVTYVVIDPNKQIVAPFATHLQALGYLEEEGSGIVKMQTAFLYDDRNKDSLRVSIIDESYPIFELITDYPEPKQIIADRKLKEQALYKLSMEERRVLHI